ncbi:MAG: TetR/AcrR family transcriptional regulator [Myxococcales bacterium]|nr:TetR/AcrR family transcriptional regulator [Myxococcales bacterium]
MTARRRDGEARREALLAAALRCFDREGVAQAGIEAIRKEAGASPSSVYHHFRDRTDLIRTLLERVFAALFAHLAAEVGQATHAEAAVRALVDAHIAWIAAHPVEGRFMYQAMTLEVGGLDAPAREALAAEKARLLQPLLVALAPHAGALPPWSPEVLDVVLLGTAHEALRRWLAGAEALNPAFLRATLPGLAWQSVAGFVPENAARSEG